LNHWNYVLNHWNSGLNHFLTVLNHHHSLWINTTLFRIFEAPFWIIVALFETWPLRFESSW
jgi:hypothetical protein